MYFFFARRASPKQEKTGIEFLCSVSGRTFDVLASQEEFAAGLSNSARHYITAKTFVTACLSLLH